MRLPGRSRHPEASPSVPHAGAARVVVYSREGCHLCEVAEAQVAEICAELGTSWTRVDIDDDPDLHQRFTEQVPVTFVDGAQHDFWRVDPERLRKALSKRP
ncbi:glutaredoxin family protein [Aeromicrobium sp. UC242_57]|uniref:glutaredoxin family protein n=1 Tax=Aeromicrobium sp. UC242_57 TaxID=3374624 RepID=UPI0037B29D9F